MTNEEFANEFQVLYNNITSDGAPGLDSYEISVFLTKAQDELVKNHFSPQSKGNSLQLGFDDSAKRQADFSSLLRTAKCSRVTGSYERIDSRSEVWEMPEDIFIPVHETLLTTSHRTLQVIPVSYAEYMRLMAQPYKRPLRDHAWRLAGNNIGSGGTQAEIITEAGLKTESYTVRYVKRPVPIILEDLDGLTIGGLSEKTECELPPILHEELLQRAAELAKTAWMADPNEQQLQTASGTRSE